MKRYNINPVEIKLSWGKIRGIVLGEEGRGRRKAIVPYYGDEKAEYLDVETSSHIKIKESRDPQGGWLAVVSGAGVYTRGTHGTVYCCSEDTEKIKILAYGKGAWGQAGRIGEWFEFLIAVPENIYLKIRPAGGKHKIPPYWLYFGENTVYNIKIEELPLFCDSMGIPPPQGGLVDLVKLID